MQSNFNRHSEVMLRSRLGG